MTPCFPRLLAAILGLSLVAIGFSTRSTAQDITVSNPEVLFSDNKPDTPPVFKRVWRVPVPKTLEKADKPCYVVIIQRIDEKGQSARPSVLGVDSDLTKIFRQSDSRPEFKPAKIGRKSTSTYVRITGILNPASASTQNKNATPRLLAVAPVIIKREEFGKLRAAKKSSRIFADFQIDETGAITGWALAEKSNYAADFRTEIDTALASWKFAPARADGKAIASTITIPFLLVSDASQAPWANTPPIPLKRTTPVYPIAMKRSGLIGKVTVSFEVNKEGNVQNPSIVKSSNPGFEAAAIETVLKWKFKPGTVNGQPATVKMQIPFIFKLDGAGDNAY